MRWVLVAGVAACLSSPDAAWAFPSKNTSCLSCHNLADADATIFSALDGVETTSVTVAPGDSFEVDWFFRNATESAAGETIGVELAVPAGWTTGPGTTNGPALGGWNSTWEAGSGYSGAWATLYDCSGEHPNSPDCYTIEFELTPWDGGKNKGAIDDGSAGDLDGQADTMGTDALVTVPGGQADGTYTVLLHGVGHVGSSKSYVQQAITVTVQSAVGDTTSIGDGTNPGNTALTPGGSAVFADAFTVSTSAGTDSISAVTVGLGTGAAAGVALVEITDDAGGTVYGSAVPASDTQVVSLGTPISAGTASTQYRIRVTPKTHAAMAAPPGATYTVSPRVTGITCSNSKNVADTASATVTIDNASPGNVSFTDVSPADGSVALTWTEPGDADYAETLVLRGSAAVTDVPVEGQSYGAGATVGAATVVYAGTAGTFTDTGLTNGANYYYAAFARDSSGNWATGAATGPHQPLAAAVVVGNGTEPGSVTVAPGSGIVDLDGFTLRATDGSDTVTSVTVTLAAGTGAAVQTVTVTDAGTGAAVQTVTVTDAGNGVLGSAAPSGDTATVSVSIPVTGTATAYKVRITPESHAAMPVPPGSAYGVTGTVTGIASMDAPSYGDSGSATVTIDNASPGNVTWGASAAGDAQVDLAWTNPGDADFDSVVVLRGTAAVTDVPVEGQTYSAGATVGGATVAYVGSASSFTDTGATNGTTWYYAAYARDTSGNYATGAQAGPFSPTAGTTLGNGTDPGNTTLGPGGAATFVDGFSFVTSNGTDSVGQVTVTLAPGTASALSLVEITDATGSTTYGSVATPGSDSVTVSLSPALSVGTSATDYRIRVTPKAHADMSGPPGTSYAVTATVTDFTSTNAKLGADASSATVTVDDAAPADVSGFGGTPGDGQVALSWTNPGADFAQVVVVRHTAPIGDAPVEGGTYSGVGTVVYTGASASYTDTGVANGTAYYYEAFARDAYGNYAAGASTGPHTPQSVETLLGNGADPANASRAPGGAVAALDSFSVASSVGSDTVTSVTVSLSAGSSAGLSLIEVRNAAGTTLHGSVSNPATDTVTIPLGTPIAVTTSPTNYTVRVTPRSHAAMPAPPGAAYVVTGTVTGLACGNTVTGSDAGSATVTIDNQSTAQVVWGAVTPGDGQVDLSWTNPGDADYASTVVVRDTAPIADAPTEGGSYAGSATLAYSGAATAITDTGLTNGTSYYYKAFAQDANGNWSVGASAGPVTPSSVASDTDAPCAPTGLHVYQRGSGSVSIRFTAPYSNCAGGNSDPDRYMIRYGFDVLDAASWSTSRVWDDAWPATVAAGAQESVTLTGLDSNQQYFVQVRAVDLNNNVGPLAVPQSAGSNAAHTYLHLGWNMAGTQNQLGATDTCQGVFGVTSCYGWASTGIGDWDGSYVDLTATGVVTPGEGYWLSIGTTNVDLDPPTDSSLTTGAVIVPLQVGMNLVVNPHDVAVPVADLSVTQDGSLTKTYAEAVAAGWVLPAVYAYDGTNYLSEPAAGLPGGMLHPRKAVWLKLAMDDGRSYVVSIPDPTP